MKNPLYNNENIDNNLEQFLVHFARLVYDKKDAIGEGK